MVRATLIALAMMAALPAQAATYHAGGSGKCAPLVEYQPSDDVAVKDGVDAKGWAVAPADLNPPSLTKESFDPVGIALDVPMKDYINEDSYNYNAEEADIWLGRINVDGAGNVDFNGRPLNSHSTVNPDCIPEKKQ